MTRGVLPVDLIVPVLPVAVFVLMIIRGAWTEIMLTKVWFDAHTRDDPLGLILPPHFNLLRERLESKRTPVERCLRLVGGPGGGVPECALESKEEGVLLRLES